MNNLQIKHRGTVLIIAFITMGILMLLGVYFLSFTLTESRIAKSQTVGTQAYYLAEAGINKAIWKLKHDDTWSTCFVTTTAECDCQNWVATFTENTDTLISNSTITVTVINSECARGEITATSTIAISSGKAAQRVVKTTVFKALGSSTENSPIFSGGTSENIDIDYARMEVEGNLFCNHNLKIKGASTVNVYDNTTTTEIEEGKVLAVGKIDISSGSTGTSTEMKANQCLGISPQLGCIESPPNPITMPSVDFDSLKNQANAIGVVYSPTEFEDLLWNDLKNNTTTTLNNITYVTGDIDLKGGVKLVVNGALVADKTIDIGEDFCWSRKGDKRCGFDQITVTDPGAGKLSGLLTKAKINFGLYSSFTDISIRGLIYAVDEMRLTSIPNSFNLTGGLMARKIALTSLWQWLNIILDNDIIEEGLAEDPGFSPVVTVEHWEESY